ncbi:unnamed protein product [Ilex paraguariensis]|uniref:Uncharacterized protein n=1 Tax=Ilex paraguariensis TaxID=185542 RepID=A0ABC8TRL2_9AQUA
MEILTTSKSATAGSQAGSDAGGAAPLIKVDTTAKGEDNALGARGEKGDALGARGEKGDALGTKEGNGLGAKGASSGGARLGGTRDPLGGTEDMLDNFCGELSDGSGLCNGLDARGGVALTVGDLGCVPNTGELGSVGQLSSICGEQ